jgi:hypothetical protein
MATSRFMPGLGVELHRGVGESGALLWSHGGASGRVNDEKGPPRGECDRAHHDRLQK